MVAACNKLGLAATVQSLELAAELGAHGEGLPAIPLNFFPQMLNFAL